LREGGGKIDAAQIRISEIGVAEVESVRIEPSQIEISQIAMGQVTTLASRFAAIEPDAGVQLSEERTWSSGDTQPCRFKVIFGSWHVASSAQCAYAQY